MNEDPPFPRLRAETWLEFQTIIEAHLDGTWLFRGVGSVRQNLIPSVGRVAPDWRYTPDLEDRLLEKFQREALPYVRNMLDQNDKWTWLAMAQHHGVPTRLLDWSESPFVSLFFAVWGNDPDDAGVYLIRRPSQVVNFGLDPFNIDKEGFFYPRHVTARITAQSGLFTVQCDPTKPYPGDGVQQIVISAQAKQDFRRKLDAIGMHHAAIYADLDGLARRLRMLEAFRCGAGDLRCEDPGGLLASDPDKCRPNGGAGPPPTATSGLRRNVTDDLARPLEAGIDLIKPRRKPPSHDPQKYQWGEESERNGWALTASVTEDEEDKEWFSIELSVRPTGDKTFSKSVTFYLHDSFPRPVKSVKPKSPKEAKYSCWAYGAFTVGVLVQQDKTMLELDLAKLESAPKLFRER